MSAIKKYFKEETQWAMFGLEYPKPTDFYLSVWQGTRSSVPLLILRTLLFLTAVAIVLTSMILYYLNNYLQFWFIYLTHWGLMTIVLATGFSVAVSARVYFYGPISAEFCLPWYVKSYWVLYNIANPIAYLITIFYWTVLYEAGVEEEFNPTLDVAVHGLNTAIMLLLLLSCSHQTRLLHIHHPLLLGLGWIIFSVIYYFAGGTDTKGNRYVYPVINWSNPGPTMLVVILTALGLLVLHAVTIGLSLTRDALAPYCKPSVISHVEEGTPLRQTQTQTTYSQR
ncbi:protein rolling stone-like [Pectinophora gossypiella]|uniref:protein rolling stone-like n=1 Tax=Pectinophora gossypiella TaxID=13191 RepID=UPI00214E443E|nr:protein rolling stone-like [Pectinophora gossypiella]